MSAYLFGWFLRRAMKGRTANQIERAFWIVVMVLAGVFLAAFLAQTWFAPRT